MEDYQTGRRELFHIGRDVSESTNLADVEPQRVEAMAAKLAAWRTSVGAQIQRAESRVRAESRRRRMARSPCPLARPRSTA